VQPCLIQVDLELVEQLSGLVDPEGEVGGSDLRQHAGEA
jgi:hypothetical protein